MYLEDSQNNELAIWRKANQIHCWFVNNVQNGVDDGQCYEVSIEQIKKLLMICKVVKKRCEFVVLEKSKNNIFSNLRENGYSITFKDTVYAELLLPTMEGFFFGRTNYDEYYFKNIQDTIDQLEIVIKNYNGERMYYRAWW